MNLRDSVLPIFPSQASIATSGVELARAAGWDARITRDEVGALEIAVRNVFIRFGGYGCPATNSDERLQSHEVNEPLGLRYLSSPPERAIQAICNALECSSAHATILAPVGSFFSPQRTGAIDSVMFAPAAAWCSNVSVDCTVSVATISHTRCWLVAVRAVAQTVRTEADMDERLRSCPQLRINPSNTAKIRDTATLGEYMRDIGYQDGRFPDVVVLEPRLAAPGVVCAWLAVTDAASAVAIAEEIGAIAAPQLKETDRFAALRSAWLAAHGGAAACE
jgi:hypothetical protein